MKYRSAITLYVDHDEWIDAGQFGELSAAIRKTASKHLADHPGRMSGYTGERVNGDGVDL